jgi:hypothetical protein
MRRPGAVAAHVTRPRRNGRTERTPGWCNWKAPAGDPYTYSGNLRSHRHERASGRTRYEVAVPDQFDLRGPAGRFHRSADCAGGVRVRRLRQCCPLGVTSAADRGRRGGRLCPSQLPCRRYSPCKDGPAPDLPWRPAAGDCSWGFNSVSWGFNSAFMVIWAGLRSRGGGAEIRTAAEGCNRAFLMNKRSEAAAAVRPDSAAPSPLAILADSAAHRAGLVRRAGDAASFRLRIAGSAGPFRVSLAW